MVTHIVSNNVKNIFQSYSLVSPIKLFGTGHKCLNQQEMKHWNNILTILSKKLARRRKRKSQAIAKLFALHANIVSPILVTRA